jgi:hypothetical protein
MSDGNAPEVVPADPRARRAAFAILALGLVVGGALVAFGTGSLEGLAARACHGDAQAASTLWHVITAVLVVVPASVVAMAAYAVVLARRTWAAAEYPPPGMRPWRPVVRLRGPSARAVAAVLASLGVLLAVAGLALLAVGGRMLAVLARRF